MVSDISTEVSESDVQLLSTELGLSDAQELEYSLQRLYSRGCTGIASVTKTKEESGWIYFVVESTDQQKFYVDTNKHGSFGTILSQDGRDNVDLMVQTLGIKENRNLLYSAEKMETSGCGRIESIKDVEHKKSYKFTIVNSDGVEYHISLSDNGEIGTIRDKDDQPVYEMKE